MPATQAMTVAPLLHLDDRAQCTSVEIIPAGLLPAFYRASVAAPATMPKHANTPQRANTIVIRAPVLFLGPSLA
jgi:hypothetical protein